MFDVYMNRDAVQKAEFYFAELAKRRLEGMGLLIGELCEHGDKEFVIVTDFITANTDASAVSVRFSRSAFESLSEELKKQSGKIVIGWCHSHPSYGCFLSSIDVNTQRRFFNESFHIASVFDPLKKERFGEVESMAKRFYRLTVNGYQEVSFAVVQ